MSIDELLARRAAVSASGLIYWIGVAIQARRIRKHIGRSPNLKPRGTKEKLLWLGWFIVIALWVGQPFLTGKDFIPILVQPASSLLNPATLIAGALLIVAGYAATLWCYAIMGDTWRIGINRKEKTSLVTKGPYGVIRHPIYAFQIVMLTGAALLLPTILSVFILVFHLACVLVKAVDEETYLLGVHGEEYQRYISRTGRLIPTGSSGPLHPMGMFLIWIVITAAIAVFLVFVISGAITRHPIATR